MIALGLVCCSCGASGKTAVIDESNVVVVPFAGNVYVTKASGDLYSEAAATIDSYKGSLVSWSKESTVLSFYIRVSGTGTLSLRVDASNDPGTKSSTLTFSYGGKSYPVAVTSGSVTTYDVGTFQVAEPGYVKIDISGSKASPAGAQLARISDFKVSGQALAGKRNFLPQSALEDSYWCRRGPSVHFHYTLPDADVEWFYNEAVVPEGSDVPCTYFMLTGFRQGYMGIQTHVNAPNSILFSVWSPYETDKPGEIPDSMKVTMLRKGAGVTVQDFGGEGSGGQSFMTYPWKAGKTYKTLVHVRPDGKGSTDFTGYFCDETGTWHLLASFKRPQTNTWYDGAHSFLECFMPESSIYTTEVHFKNQWARLTDGTWKEVTQAKFTCDNTGKSGERVDYFGAVQGDELILKHCGFFSGFTEYGTMFTRASSGASGSTSGSAPVIDFAALEAL